MIATRGNFHSFAGAAALHGVFFQIPLKAISPLPSTSAQAIESWPWRIAFFVTE
jgi:hypothetical protein